MLSAASAASARPQTAAGTAVSAARVANERKALRYSMSTPSLEYYHRFRRALPANGVLRHFPR